jgi:hypothetical protein
VVVWKFSNIQTIGTILQIIPHYMMYLYIRRSQQLDVHTLSCWKNISSSATYCMQDRFPHNQYCT